METCFYPISYKALLDRNKFKFRTLIKQIHKEKNEI